MTAVLARIARAAAEAVLLTAAVFSMLWVPYGGPQGLWTLARLAVMAATVGVAAWCWTALSPKGGGGG